MAKVHSNANHSHTWHKDLLQRSIAILDENVPDFQIGSHYIVFAGLELTILVLVSFKLSPPASVSQVHLCAYKMYSSELLRVLKLGLFIPDKSVLVAFYHSVF